MALTPPPSGLREVERPQLVQLVTATEPGGVCVLAAAPGYGASTLLDQVARATSDAVVRLRIGDRGLWDVLAGELARLSGADLAATPEAIREALETAGPLWVMLELDDVAFAGAAIDGAIDRLAGSLPPDVRLAVASHRSLRCGPAVASRLVEIDERQLAIRADEAVELLPGLDPATVEAVWEVSEGWVAALSAAESQRALDTPSVTGWLKGPGADRLLGAWFDGLPPQQADFLVGTAVLEELSTGACDAVMQRHDSAAMLGDLVRDHCFVTEMQDAAERRLRRHPLLTELLRQRVDSYSELLARHSRAADWYAGAGDVVAAMHHLISAGRQADAGEFLRRHESDLFTTGRGDRAADWYDRLPEEALGTRALRLLRIAWGQALSGEPEDAEVWLARLRALDPAPDDEPVDDDLVFEGETLVLEAYLAAFRGDASTMAAAGERAIAAFGRITERDSEQLAYVLRIKGLQWSGDHDRAARLLDWLDRRPFANDMIRESSLASLRAYRWRQEGRINDAYRVADRSVRWLRRQGLATVGRQHFNVYGEWAAALLERGDVGEAAEALEAAAVAAASGHRVGEQAATLVVISRARRARRDAGAALRVLRQARTLLSEVAPGTPLLHSVDAAEARIRIDTGDGVRAERLIRSLPADVDRSLLWSRLRLARGADARRLLSTLDPANPREAAEHHLLLATASLRRGVRLAEQHLLRAGDIAYETGQALLLLEAPQPVVDLAAEASRRHGHDGLAWLHGMVRGDATQVAQALAAPSSTSVLSRGELELVALLPGRETVAGLGRILGVTPNTVKTRLQRLYRKLGVSGRDEAIAAARSRGLL